MTSLVRSILWRRVDEPGAEIMELRRSEPEWNLRGTAVLSFDGRPAHVRYDVTCDRPWRTRSVDLVETWGDETRSLHLEADQGARWWWGGDEIVAVSGSVDVDLGMTPATNTLPIRRLALALGESRELTVAWIRFPDLVVEPLRQRYTRLQAQRYRYESIVSGFSADIDVDELGLVTRYSELWELVASFDP